MTPRELTKRLAVRLLGGGDVRSFVRTRKLAMRKRLYRTEISIEDFRCLLGRLGFARGRVVWLQSSWNELYNLPAKPSEIVDLMLDLLGPTGTLVMPAFPLDQSPSKLLLIDSAPSSTGLLTEVFRRYHNVERSIHLTSSVCALGPQAVYLVRDHHRDKFSWGPMSPYCRLMDVDARLVSLGLDPYVSWFTPVHAVECLLYEDIPFFKSVFDGTVRYRWRRRNGEEGEHEFMRRIGRINARAFKGYFSTDAAVEARVSNLNAFAIDARRAIAGAVDLGRRGVTVYLEPKPRPELFRPMARGAGLS